MLSDAYLGEKRPGEEDALQLVIKMYNIHDSKNCDRKKHRTDAGRDRAALERIGKNGLYKSIFFE